jgi:hypothetical protein
MSVDTGDKPCPNQARADEMRINVVRSDAKQMTNLTATFYFAGEQQEWNCSSATLDGILCQAMPNMITIIAPVEAVGEIKSVDLSDPAGFSYSGEVALKWSNLPVSYGCSNTYRRGVFDVTLAQ